MMKFQKRIEREYQEIMTNYKDQLTLKLPVF